MTPRPLNVPSNNPILAKQREHSTCIQPVTTIQYPKSRIRLRQPLTNTDIPPPCGHMHEIRPLIPRIFRRRSGKGAAAAAAAASGMSETMSSRNTSFEISRDMSVEDFTAAPAVPHVDLRVSVSHDSVDYYSSAEIWVCIEATVRAKTWLEGDGVVVIPSLRFCYKPVEGCEVLEFVGEKSVKDLKAGQTSQLFLRLRLPKLREVVERKDTIEWSQEELFEHLESMLGVHEMECLQIEVKYRYPQIPSDNVMTVKHLCRIKRPKRESAWSMCSSRGLGSSSHDQAVDVHNKLAKLRATQQSHQAVWSPSIHVQSPRTHVSQPEVVISQVSGGGGGSSGDTARQLWQDLKRRSLSTQQLVELSPGSVEQLAASDASLHVRRQQALANKRSVGVETLRGWKWDEKEAQGREVETPWL